MAPPAEESEIPGVWSGVKTISMSVGRVGEKGIFETGREGRKGQREIYAPVNMSAISAVPR
jgi:hypothetical protein